LENDNYIYSGHENLLAMQCALNYNRFLNTQLLKYWKKCKRVLDFGAGMGVYAKKFKEFGVSPLCVEPDKNQAEYLKSCGFKVISNIDQEPMDTFQFIYSLNVLEHIENDQKEIINIYRVLDSGGTFFVYVPAIPWIYSSMDRLVGHFRRYKKSELKMKLQNAGFIIESCTYVDFLGVWASLVYKHTDRSGGRINLSAIRLYDRFIFPMSQLFDFFFKKIIGKNLLIICKKA
jgi:SAM-dependent methyltransferase